MENRKNYLKNPNSSVFFALLVQLIFGLMVFIAMFIFFLLATSKPFYFALFLGIGAMLIDIKSKTIPFGKVGIVTFNGSPTGTILKIPGDYILPILHQLILDDTRLVSLDIRVDNNMTKDGMKWRGELTIMRKVHNHIKRVGWMNSSDGSGTAMELLSDLGEELSRDATDELISSKIYVSGKNSDPFYVSLLKKAAACEKLTATGDKKEFLNAQGCDKLHTNFIYEEIGEVIEILVKEYVPQNKDDEDAIASEVREIALAKGKLISAEGDEMAKKKKMELKRVTMENFMSGIKEFYDKKLKEEISEEKLLRLTLLLMDEYKNETLFDLGGIDGKDQIGAALLGFLEKAKKGK